MPWFFEDNNRRAARVEQLTDSTASLQADVRLISELMDKVNSQYRPAINDLLQANGMKSVDDVIQAAAMKMTPESRKAYEGLVQSLKNIQSGLNWGYLVAALLIAAGIIGFGVGLFPQATSVSGLLAKLYSGCTCRTSALAIAIVRFCWKINFTKAIANVCCAFEAGMQAAADGFRFLASELEKSEAHLKFTVIPCTKAAYKSFQLENIDDQMLGIAVSFAMDIRITVVTAVGLFATGITGLFDLLIASDQKKKLITTIHELQPLRLEVALQKQHLIDMHGQLELVRDYLNASKGGSNTDAELVAETSQKIISAITAENTRHNDREVLNALQRDLEKEDRMSSKFYGGDDLSRDEVVTAVYSKIRAQK